MTGLLLHAKDEERKLKDLSECRIYECQRGVEILLIFHGDTQACMATGTQETLGTRRRQQPGGVMSGRTQALPILVPGSWSNYPISPRFAVALKDPRQC